jgi:hypothetical protein
LLPGTQRAPYPGRNGERTKERGARSKEKGTRIKEPGDRNEEGEPRNEGQGKTGDRVKMGRPIKRAFLREKKN